MAITLTKAGEALIAQLFADGAPLVIDQFLFAYVDGQDHTAPINTAAGVPEADIVHRATIPDEYRGFINPNAVVYSSLIGSDVGDFALNWQGLYCTAHNTLVAVSTFPALQKRAYNPGTNTAGNNLTRNFMLEFTGAQRLTEIFIEAKVWQLDFSVRLKGIDERERLSNRDIYGRAAFLDEGWKLVQDDAGYKLLAGVGYVEGIRIALPEDLPVTPTCTPCSVWVDVCMEPEGSDVVAKARLEFVPQGETLQDYTTPAPYRIRHYCEKIAHFGGAFSPPSARAQTLFGLTVNSAGQLVVARGETGDYFPGKRLKGLALLPTQSNFILQSGELVLQLP